MYLKGVWGKLYKLYMVITTNHVLREILRDFFELGKSIPLLNNLDKLIHLLNNLDKSIHLLNNLDKPVLINTPDSWNIVPGGRTHDFRVISKTI